MLGINEIYQVSIHAPHEGERLRLKPRRKMPTCFNPRSPRGGATVGDAYVWGAQGVSIHAPHEGERLKLINDLSDQICVSIHAPHEGERPIRDGFSREEFVFQSTLPTRGSDNVQI